MRLSTRCCFKWWLAAIVTVLPQPARAQDAAEQVVAETAASAVSAPVVQRPISVAVVVTNQQGEVVPGALVKAWASKEDCIQRLPALEATTDANGSCQFEVLSCTTVLSAEHAEQGASGLWLGSIPFAQVFSGNRPDKDLCLDSQVPERQGWHIGCTGRPERLSEGVKLRLLPRASLSGLVSTADGLPAAGASVSAVIEAGLYATRHNDCIGLPPEPVLTGPDGRYTLVLEPRLAGEVTATLAGQRSVSRFVGVSPGDAEEHDLVLGAPWSLEAHVIDRAGRRIPNAEVIVINLEERPRKLKSDAKGRIEVKGLVADECVLVATAGTLTQLAPLKVFKPVGLAASVSIALVPGEDVSGTVAFSCGHLAPGADMGVAHQGDIDPAIDPEDVVTTLDEWVALVAMQTQIVRKDGSFRLGPCADGGRYAIFEKTRPVLLNVRAGEANPKIELPRACRACSG